ncbi:MAG: YebC/PmpR family DNA-binding transcriptional regulator [Christensenellales bacterium]|jgi:YebC/PmpR family DNA-binding regulatory protein
MSGHSKWATIRRKKEKTDAARGAAFTRIGRELMIAAREGADPASNAKLRDAVAKAKAANIPNDNINRWIKRASGEGENVQYDEITYEGYGVQGSAVVVETLTDNKNRTASDVRHCFDKCGGSLGTTNCVTWMFDRKGIIVIEKTYDMDDDEMMEQALEANAEDFTVLDEAYEITTSPNDFTAVREALEAKGFSFAEAQIEMVPQNTVALEGDNAARFQRMLDMLDELDDVQNVYHNADFPEEEE